jgi:putative chitinase
MPRYGIDTLPRIASFLATVCFESDYLKATKEYADGKAYDKSVNPKKAKELGNTEKGDGPKYKGRGIIQTTGKANYQEFTEYIQSKLLPPGTILPDFVKKPELLEMPVWAVESACYFWHTHDLNKYADDGNFYAIQGIVNRGNPTKRAKDYPARQELYAKSIQFLQSTPSTRPPQNSPVTNDNTLAQGETLPPQDSVDANTPPIASPEPFFTSAIDKVTAPFITAKGKFDQLGVDPSSISRSSFWNIAAAKVVGWPALIFGFFTDHWEYILGGTFLVAVAYLVFFGAKRNATNRVVASVQDPGASK